jgi:tRNA-specific 2-thiouridylase
VTGDILGEHHGVEGYTIGQRKGLNLALGKPMYVVELRNNGDVIIGDREDLMDTDFQVDEVKYMGIDPEFARNNTIKAKVLIRYNSTPIEVTFKIDTSGKLIAKLQNPAMAITPGQSAVFYDPEKNFILAGGKIKKIIS